MARCRYCRTPPALKSMSTTTTTTTTTRDRGDRYGLIEWAQLHTYRWPKMAFFLSTIRYTHVSLGLKMDLKSVKIWTTSESSRLLFTDMGCVHTVAIYCTYYWLAAARLTQTSPCQLFRQPLYQSVERTIRNSHSSCCRCRLPHSHWSRNI